MSEYAIVFLNDSGSVIYQLARKFNTIEDALLAGRLKLEEGRFEKGKIEKDGEYIINFSLSDPVIKLKPCPHCNSGNISVVELETNSLSYNPPYEYQVVCNHCGAISPICSTKKEIAKHWNRRAQP